MQEARQEEPDPEVVDLYGQDWLLREVRRFETFLDTTQKNQTLAIRFHLESSIFYRILSHYRDLTNLNLDWSF